MAITAGHATVFSLCATYNGTYVAAAGLTQADLNKDINLLESTAFSDTTFRKRIAGLRDFTVDVSGFFEVDATSQGLLRSVDGTEIFFKFLFDGTNGYGCVTTGGGALCNKWGMGAAVDGLVTFKATILSSKQALEEIGTAD